MNVDDGTLSFGTAIDMGGFDEGAAHIEQKVSEIGDKAEAESARISELLTNVPDVNIDVITNASESLAVIQQGFDEIDRVVDTNKAAIRDLEKEYDRLGVEMQKAYKRGDDKEYNRLKKVRSALKENIAIRNKVNEEAAKTADKLAETERTLQKEAEEAAKSADKHSSLRQRIRELKEELVMMEAAGDRNSAKYREVQEEVGRLTDAWSDATSQANVLAHDQRGLQGIISGLSGISGAASVAQGAVGLFGGENEKLQQIMMRVQSLMAITIGLQQIQQTLNKDSAFSLVTLNSLKKIWAKLIGESSEAIETENAAIAQNTAANESNTVATNADTTAQNVNNTSTKAGTAAQTANAASTKTATAATVAQTVATKAASLALKGLKAALISTGIGALIVLVGELINGLMSLFEATSKADKEFEEETEIIKEAGKAYIQEKVALEDNIRKLERFNGTKAQEKKLVEDLNSKYGATLGYHKSRSEWLTILKTKGEAYCQMMLMEAKAQAILNKYTEAYINLLEVKRKAENGDYDSHWYNPFSWFGDNAEEATADAEAQLKRWEDMYKDLQSQIGAFKDANDFNFHSNPSAINIKGSGGSGGSGRGIGATFDPIKAAIETQKAIESWKSKVKKYLSDANNEVTQLIIDGQEEGLTKELNTSRNATRRRLDDWDNQFRQLAEQRKEYLKALYMQQNGATEAGWYSSEAGKKSIEQYMKDLLNDGVWGQLLTSLAQKRKETLRQAFGGTDAEWLESDAGKKPIEEYARELVENTEWDSLMRQLAEKRKEALRTLYMQQDGATEQGWLNSDEGKKSIDDYIEELSQEESAAKDFYRVLSQITENGRRELSNIRQKYDDILIEQYGTNLQKQELLYRKWMNKMKFIPAEYIAEATRQMDEEFAKLSSENFKEIIDWDSVFGSLDKQSIQSLQINLERVKKYFEENKETMDGKEIKEYTDAIKQMEDEIASRNPFAAMHKSIKDMSASKTELVNALKELSTAQNELNAAEEAYKNAMQEQREVNEAIERGELAQDCQQQADAADNLRQATERLAAAQKKNAQAENSVINSRNNLTQSYKSFAQNLKNAGGVIKDVGGKAKNLAQVFSDDLADGIGKGLDFIDDILGAASDVISAVSDVGKSAAKGIESTVDAAAQGATASAAAGASAISTIEKASVILAVISAALQVATAIANLFNNDDEKQEEIERLQERIDQLQWELDNQDAVRLQNNIGDAVARVRDVYKETYEEVLRLHREEMRDTNIFKVIRMYQVAQNEAYLKSIEKIADAYAKADYTANKFLGEDKYKNSRKQLENLAEQQLLLQKQIDEENSKKHDDQSKIADWRREIQEIANEMAEIINEMMEDIIGTTAEDLAQTLGDAFFDAVAQGEDAMEAWHQKVNEIVRDILKRMMITQFLEPAIGKIFDKYKKIWFDEKGNFQGINTVKNSANNFANDLNNAGEQFSQIYSALNQGMKDLFEDTAERQGESRGIATASQDSVDENNARLTTIQGHTYSLVQGVTELNATSNQILARVTGIERNTDETNNKLDNMNTRIKRIEDSVDDIQRAGIKIKV